MVHIGKLVVTYTTEAIRWGAPLHRQVEHLTPREYSSEAASATIEAPQRGGDRGVQRLRRQRTRLRLEEQHKSRRNAAYTYIHIGEFFKLDMLQKG